MGYASHEGKAFAIEHMQHYEGQDDPKTFLDLGAGAGSWMEAVRPWFLDSKWIAMEVWEPYIERFCLGERYDLTIAGDVRNEMFPVVDVIFMGDVLEHMAVEEAVAVWDRARDSATQMVVLSIPIVHYEQGEVHGNPYQTHVHADWSDEMVRERLDGITASWQGSTVGVYIGEGLAAQPWTPDDL